VDINNNSQKQTTTQKSNKVKSVKKPFTIWDYLINLFSARDSKVSTIVFELIASFILLIYLLITKAEIQSWLGNTIKWALIGVVGENSLGTGLNYLYNNYTANQTKQPKRTNYDFDHDKHVDFKEYISSLLSTREEKFSTIALVNLCSFGIAIYLQLSGQIVPQIITEIIQYSITALACVNVLGTGLGMPGYSSYGYGSYGGYGGYDYGYTQGINTQSTTDINNDGQDPV
jgi:hypothetical protein